MAHGIPSESVIEFPVQWHRNQAKMFKESALAFSAQSKELHIQSDYALLVEILGNRHKTHVGGVHFFLINQQGEFVNVRLNNSHWDEYKAIEPKNETDGLEVAKLMMKNAWVE